MTDRIVYPRFAMSFVKYAATEAVRVLDVISAPTAADAVTIFGVRHKFSTGAYWMKAVECACVLPFDEDAPACFAASRCESESWDDRRKAIAEHRKKRADWCQCACHKGSDETNVEVPPRPRGER